MATETTAPPPAAQDHSFFGHPRGLATLFFTEMWERFSYYGMSALLVLYLTASVTNTGSDGPGLGFDDATAVAIYGTYTGLVYLLPIGGGWVADRLIGPKRTVLWGGIIIALGHYSLAVPVDAMFWVGLLLIAGGTGLLKPNISAMVGDLYGTKDTRRDAGFSIFYMGINIGALLAPLVTSWAADRHGYHWGFAIAGIGMTFAVIQYILGRKNLDGIGDVPPDPADTKSRQRAVYIVIGSLALVAVLTAVIGLFTSGSVISNLTTAVTIAILIVPIVYFWGLFANKESTLIEKDRVKAFVWLFLGAAAFWMVFQQAGSTLNLFAQNVTNLQFGSWTMPAGWLQSVNPLFIVIFAPIFAAFWAKLANRAPTTPRKFAIALFGAAISFLILIIPMSQYQENGQKAALWWLITTYLLQTWAELFLSPTGLSATTKLAPEGASGQMLALWFVATAVGTSIGGQIGKFTANDPVNTFLVCAAITILAGIVMWIFSKKVSRLMHGVH